MMNILLSSLEQQSLIKASFETLELLLWSALISIPLGTLLGYIFALYGKDKIYQNKWIAYTLSMIVSIIRSIPFVLFMVIIIPISFNLFKTSYGFIPSIISLTLIGIATTARLVEQAIVDLNPNIYRLAKSLGANKYQLFRHFIFIEARSSLILAYTSSLISLLAYSSVLYIIGGGGLGYTAIQIGYYSPVGHELMYASTIIMVIMVQLIQMLGNLLANYLNNKKRG